MSLEADPNDKAPYVRPASLTRPALNVVLWRDPLAAAECFEGYSPSNNVVEPDVFDLYYVQAHPGNPPGTGTRVVREALAQASLRGFNVGRSYLLNPRMVTILAKIQAEGRIEGLKFSRASTRPTEQLLASSEFFDARHAAICLNLAGDVVGRYALDGVFRIA